MMHAGKIRTLDLDHFVAMPLEQRSHFRGRLLAERSVRNFAPLRCKIGSS